MDGKPDPARVRRRAAKEDHKYRADRLLYAENYGAALRAAALAGADEMALAEARIAAARGPLSPALLKAVPPALKSDPGLLFARIQDARRSDRAYEAATLIGLAPNDRAALINPDKWWTERRMVARELLDLNEPKLAYEICDKAVRPDEAASQVDLDFHAGWIALRFLGDAPAAAKWFALAAEAADTPLSIARAAYWRGRAAEAMGDVDDATLHYESAASEPIAYYGQLAAARLGVKRLQLTRACRRRGGRGARRVGAGDRGPLPRRARRPRHCARLRGGARMARRSPDGRHGGGGEALRRRGGASSVRQDRDDARLRLRRDGVPPVRRARLSAACALGRSCERLRGRPPGERIPVARRLGRRREGAHADPAFDGGVDRPAGGGTFDPVRLIVDPAFNTQLGAAFLGQVMEDVGGSPELSFAAYNAGPGRVAQWIAAYGDPRKGTADLVDWVERIPFDETRDYVQRVAENLGVYRQRLADEPPARAPVSVFAAKE